MNRKRRRICLTLIILTFAVALFAASNTIVGSGTGATKSEAENNSLLALSSQIKSTVNSLESISTFDTTSGEGAESSYVQSSNISTDLVLLGVVTTSNKTASNSWSATSTINSSSIPLYNQEMLETKRTIEELASLYQDSDSIETRKRNLASQMYYYNLFDAYRVIAIRLGDTNIPQLQKTRIGAELAYQSILEEEQTNLESVIQGYESQKLSALQTAAYNELKQAKDQLSKIYAQQALFKEEYVRRQEEALKYVQQQNQKQLDAMNAKVSQQLATMTVVDPMKQSITQLIDQVELKKQRYHGVLQTVQGELLQRKDQAQAELDRQVKAIRDKAYPAAELSGGQPIERAKQKREQEIDALISTFTKSWNDAQQALVDSVAPQTQQILDSIWTDYQTISNTKFSVDSIKDNVVIAVDNYDGERCSWPFVIKTRVLGKSIQLDGYLPYEQVVGKQIPNFNVLSDAYDDYIDQVEIFEAFLLGGNALQAELEFSVSIGAEASSYKISLNKLVVRRLDTQNPVISLSIPSGKEYSFTYTAQPQISIPLEADVIRVNTYVTETSTSNIYAPSTTEYPMPTLEEPRRDYRNTRSPGYYRNGLILDVGYGIGGLDSSNPSIYSLMSVEYPLTVYPYLYVGPAVDILLDIGAANSDNVFRGVNFSLMVGGVLPFNLIGFQMKAYIDYRFGGGIDYTQAKPQFFSSFNSMLNFGLSYELWDEFWMDTGIKVNVTGKDVGLCTLYVGFGIDLGGIW